MTFTRKLVSIMFTDIVGYTKLMQQSESKAIKLRDRHRAVFDTLHDSFGGKIIQYFGDGTLSIFESAGDAVRCAIEIQRSLRKNPKVPIRIGIHLGDIVITDDDIFGDSVNIASRIESLGTSGSVLISHNVMDEIKNQDDLSHLLLGEFHFKNDTHPRSIYALSVPGVFVPEPDQYSGKLEQKIREKRIESMAVLPLGNYTGTDEQEFIVAGIHDNLITAISRISSLRVISKTSTLAYKKTKKTLTEIAKELNVDAVIEGSVSKNGNNVVLNLQLIRAYPKEDHIWAEIYDRPLGEIFSLLNEITQTISQKVDFLQTKKVVKDLSKVDPVNPEAYQSYLRGRFHIEKLSYEGLKTSMSYLERAISIDPNFAPAYAALAFSLTAQVQMGIISSPEAMPKIYKAIHKSLSLDPNIVEAHLGIAAVQAFVEWNWKQSEMSYKKAFKLDPNDSIGRAYYAHVLMLGKRFKEAVQQAELALELDPYNALVLALCAKVFYGDGKIQRALALATESYQLDPNNISLLRNLDMCYYTLGDFDKSIRIQKRILRKDKDFLSAIKEGYAEKDYKKAMLSIARTKENYSNQRFVQPMWVAIAYNRAGYYDDAIKWLERGFQLHDQDMPYVFIMHEFEELRKDRRFQRIAEKINVPL